MNKFLKLIGFLAITSMLMATVGFLVLPSQIPAYIQDGKEIFVSSFTIYYFAIANLIVSSLAIYYLKKVQKVFDSDEYPTKITVISFCVLILSCLLNLFTYLVLNMFLNVVGKPLSPFIVKRFFTLIGILTAVYGYYLRKATLESDLAIRNKWAMHNELIFKFSNQFSSIVFFVGAIFIVVLSFMLPNLKQLYFMTLTVLLICGISALYISKTIYKKYKTMYKKK